MNRQEKEKAISSARELLSESQAVFIVNYKGLSVSSIGLTRRVTSKAYLFAEVKILQCKWQSKGQ